jgi:hypothetical protein
LCFGGPKPSFWFHLHFQSSWIEIQALLGSTRIKEALDIGTPPYSEPRIWKGVKTGLDINYFRITEEQKPLLPAISCLMLQTLGYQERRAIKSPYKLCLLMKHYIGQGVGTLGHYEGITAPPADNSEQYCSEYENF